MFWVLYGCSIVCSTLHHCLSGGRSVSWSVGGFDDWRMGDLWGSQGYLAANFWHHATHFWHHAANFWHHAAHLRHHVVHFWNHVAHIWHHAAHFWNFWIGATICIGREILCLPYAGFFTLYFQLHFPFKNQRKIQPLFSELVFISSIHNNSFGSGEVW